jgi:hypothetical protein
MHLSQDRPTPTRTRRRRWPRLLACLLLIGGQSLLVGGRARAASTGTASLLTPQGSGAVSEDGDYISSNNPTAPATPLDTIYRYFIEVPSGLARLRIQIFDADVGGGGAAEGTAQRDRTRGTGTNPYTTSVKYTLINPAGTTVATQTCAANANAGFCLDDTWSSILDTTTTPIANGHWELDVDQSSAQTTGIDINAFGIRADDGDATSGGTEIPVYYSAQNQIGQNPPATGSGTKTYTFYPYITSGCSFTENDFDYDNGTGTAGQNVGSIGFTSRTGSFTDNFAAAALSANNVWKSNSVTGYTSASDSVDYGIWTMVAAISNYNNPATNPTLNGNYANIYIANSSSAGGAPANNSPTANTFRVYFATDGGTAPVKPYMEQETRYVFLAGAGGPNPPAVGSTTINQVTVQVVNPTAEAITFSATNLVTVNVPGAGVTYGGNAAVTQGTITAQPAVNGTGNITWNPGTVAAGATALLTYQVKITPTTAGQNLPVVGTVASGNGTKGVWVDETGNTTQTRATLTFGPLCELSATVGTISAAEVVNLHATAASRGVVVEWKTVAEIAAAGFDLYREDPATKTWNKVNRAMVPAVPGAPQGGYYRVIDEDAPAAPGTALHYAVVETETTGGTRSYPSLVVVQAAGAEPAGGDGGAAAGSASLDGSTVPSPRRDPLWAQRLAATAPRSDHSAPGETVAGGSAGSTGGLEIGVRADGLYRIAPSVLAPLLGTDKPKGSTLALTNQGQPVAFTVDAAGGLLFYGQASTSIYSLDNVYWLNKGHGTVMSVVPGGNPATTGSPSAAFASSVQSEQESFAATTVPADPDSDYWYWDFLIAGDPTNGAKSYTVASPNAAGGAGSLTVHLAGALTAQNHVQVTLNGTAVGETTWSGAVPQVATFPVSGFNAGGANTVGLTAVLDPGVSSSIVYLQSFDAAYPRFFTATGDALAFTGSGAAPVTVSGFSGPAVTVLDVANPRLPALVKDARTDTVGSVSRVTLQPLNAATPYFAAGPTAVQSPAWIKPASGVLLTQQPGGANYLVLTTSDLIPAATSLAALRSAQGLRTAVVDVADVMTAFNFGLSSPHAIQAFLQFVRAHWNPVPRYVLLAGAGNFDYRNFTGFGGNLVPPLMESTADGLFASDNHLADVDGDGVPDFAIGRLPVVSAAELQAYVAKVAAYEATAGSSWIAQALMLADEPGPNDGVTDFAGDSVALAASLPAGYAPQQIVVTSAGIAGERAALFSGLAGGAGLVSYLGHAGLDQLSPAGLLTASDVPSMSNGPRLPLMSALTCDVNRFDVPGFTPLGALLAIQPGGGAIAVWSSSGLSLHAEGKALGQMFTYALANPANLRFGDAVQEALQRYAAIPGLSETLDLYTVLGDPAILMKPVVQAGGPGTSTNQQE